MISVAAPLWLLAIGVVPVIWWLHRARGHGRPVPVASVLLFRDLPATRSGGARAPVTDPAWRRRAAIAVLLTLALAGSTLRGSTRDIVVWVDDGPTMATRETGGTRLAAGFAALRSALPHDPTAHIELRSLSEPGLHYRADQQAPAARARQARVPVAASLPTQAAQWLLTDGANAALEDWARGGAIERVIRVGQQTENVGVLALAVRAHLSDPERLDGRVTVFNAGRQPARRDLELLSGREQLVRQSLELSPGQTRAVDFSLPRPKPDSAGLEARLSPSDALPDDDHLELDARTLERRRVRVGSGCPEALRNAVAAQTDLELAASPGAADMAITCSADDDGAPGAIGPLPTLVMVGRSAIGAPSRVPNRASDAHDTSVDAVWSPVAAAALSETLLPRILELRDARSGAPPDAEALLRSSAGTLVWRDVHTPRRVETRIDLGASALAAAPEYPLLVAELLELAAGEPLLARVAAVYRDPRTIAIAPAPADAAVARNAAGAGGRRGRPGTPLAPLWVAIAGALILWDLAVSLRLTTRLARAERGA